ncbi:MULTISPECIES: MATE family efflux transporter [unclassified Methanosarcina]|uniref:MATE family efflux transporter n=1 Tax=unclassified Methanosarcina TaxID=2644672 RepID=UPI000615453D|nr:MULTISPECIES: MATE family efflux transporter [unclassified Methanosarcina]AKB18279.1 Multi antimicrobial extrusion protein (Na(+)/drug antiporter), MATE family of MDR efflux pumps [Methanosarcina sp. WWM596]AKB21603.1 Multi antimicrobial extrusion protein (Na(+)/drug antiporter), MATE family of MDR efflux pumps [Methanosarcina sp. WH1]
MEEKSDILGKEDVKKLLFKLSLPGIIAMIVQAFYNVVDTFFVAKAYGAEESILAIGGLTIAFPIQMILIGIAVLLGTGSASVISRALGAKEIERARRALGNVYSAGLVTGVLIFVFSFSDFSPVLKAFGATEGIMPYAVEYIQVILAGAITCILGISIQNIVRAEGNARFSMNAMLLGAGLNIVLDPLLIFGLGMGVRGAAVATVFSQGVCALWLLHYFLAGKSAIHFGFEMLKPDPGILKEITAIGAGPFVMDISQSVNMIFVNAALAIYGGDVAIAVYGLIFRLFSFVFMPLIGLSFGLQPIAGYNYGAGKPERVIKAVKIAALGAVSFGTIGFMVMFLFPQKLLSIFSSDPALLDLGKTAMRIFVLGIPLVGINIIGATLFQALGRAKPSFILSVSRPILFFLPMVLLLPRLYDLNGVWVAFPVADLMAVVLTLYFLFREHRIFQQISGLENAGIENSS